MATIVVHNNAEFTAAVAKVAAAGGIIQLAPGNYAPLIFNGNKFANRVAVTSLDASAPAKVSYIKMTNSSNIIVSNLVVDGTDSTADSWCARSNLSTNITFSNVRFVGAAEGVMTNRHGGLLIQNSSKVEVITCGFEWNSSALNVNKSDHVNIYGNAFNNMNGDAIQCAAVDTINIVSNNFCTFDSLPGYHADPIQFFTSGTTVSSKNITIASNLIYIGDSTAPQSGIFIQDETTTLPYENVTIVNNIAVGIAWNSIVVKNSAGNLIVKNNIVSTWPGPSCGIPDIRDLSARIQLTSTAAALVTMEGNKAQSYIVDKGSTFLDTTKNPTIKGATDKGISLIKDWYTKNPLPNISKALMKYLK
jgi:hypothetical protein